jgi:hypothetical protein
MFLVPPARERARRLSRFLRLGCAVVGCCAVASACHGAENSGREHGSTHRRFVVERWDTLWVVGGPRDSTLLNPFLLAASNSLVFVYDGGARRVVALSARDGTVAWRYGRAGSGPDEFRSVRDLKATGDGGVAVLDPRNNRITVLDRRGMVRRRIPLDQVGHSEQMAPLGRDKFVLLTMLSDSPFVVVDTGGRVLRHASFPWPEYARLDPLARQGVIAADGGPTWVFGFSMGDGWIWFDDVSPRSDLTHYVERTEFPTVENRQNGEQASSRIAAYQVCSGCSLSISNSTLYVHFGGSEAPKRIVDRYDLGSRQYMGSEGLPLEATVVEGAGDRRYVLGENPFPILLALKPAGRSRPKKVPSPSPGMYQAGSRL